MRAGSRDRTRRPPLREVIPSFANTPRSTDGCFRSGHVTCVSVPRMRESRESLGDCVGQARQRDDERGLARVLAAAVVSLSQMMEAAFSSARAPRCERFFSFSCGARPAQDRTLKKVEEGVEIFDEIWDKVYSVRRDCTRISWLSERERARARRWCVCGAQKGCRASEHCEQPALDLPPNNGKKP